MKPAGRLSSWEEHAAFSKSAAKGAQNHRLVCSAFQIVGAAAMQCPRPTPHHQLLVCSYNPWTNRCQVWRSLGALWSYSPLLACGCSPWTNRCLALYSTIGFQVDHQSYLPYHSAGWIQSYAGHQGLRPKASLESAALTSEIEALTSELEEP